MARVPRSWRFSDPTRWKDVDSVRACAKYPKNKIDWYVTENWRHKSKTPQIYKDYEYEFAKSLESLIDHEFIFITGLSPDLTRENPFGFRPETKGFDWFQDQNKLSNEVMKLHAKIDSKNLENIIYFPVAPVSFPIRIIKKGENYVMVHPLQDIVNKVNRKARKEGKGKFGTTIKIYDTRLKDISFTPQVGNYKFSPIFFQKPMNGDFFTGNEVQQYEMAQRYGITKEEVPENVGLARYIHRMMLRNKFKSYLDKLNIKNPTLYALNGSYASVIFKPFKPKRLNIGRSLEYPLYAEAEPASLGILEHLLGEFA